MTTTAPAVIEERDSHSHEGAIEIEKASKLYILHKQKPYLLHEVVKRVSGMRSTQEEFWALKDVSFQVRHGESVAIIGRNGAGKSTLLGLVAGSIYPTSGRVKVNGRLGALLELGAGFHPDLTGRENIYLNASLLGLDKDEIEDQFASILGFSELHDFIDVPLKNYSSGMQVRLGFSVAIHIDPDIIIMDEALSVGDAAFQGKCIERILSLKAKGKTLLFVSHSATQVESLCARVIWLEHGKVRMDGPTAEVMKAYAAG
jgi:ABC-type polysaccharide/polyol phosphate transport system ATPase subunit